jgi:hypothetical protein
MLKGIKQKFKNLHMPGLPLCRRGTEGEAIQNKFLSFDRVTGFEGTDFAH